jgi:hypothetical protein
MLLLVGAQQAVIAQIPDCLCCRVGEVVMTTLGKHFHFVDDQFGPNLVGRIDHAVSEIRLYRQRPRDLVAFHRRVVSVKYLTECGRPLAAKALQNNTSSLLGGTAPLPILVVIPEH